MNNDIVPKDLGAPFKLGDILVQVFHIFIFWLLFIFFIFTLHGMVDYWFLQNGYIIKNYNFVTYLQFLPFVFYSVYIMVGFFVFLILFVILNRYIRHKKIQEPNFVNPKIASFLTIVTLLFLTLFLFDNLITFATLLLNGTLDTNFIIHLLINIVFCLILFLYFAGVKKADLLKPKNLIFAIITLIVIIVAFTLFTFYKNPVATWNKAGDDKRYFDYSIIVSSIRTYFSQNEKLPGKFSDIKKMQRLAADESQYTYKTLSDHSYAICSTFSTNTLTNRSSASDKLYYPTPSNFWHKKGYDCITYYIEDFMQRQKYETTNMPTNDSQFFYCTNIYDRSIDSKPPVQGVYELDNQVVFTKNKVTTSVSIEYWMPGVDNNSPTIIDLSPYTILVDTRNTLTGESLVNLKRGMEYKLLINNVYSTPIYTFQGNRIVVEDPRCLPSKKNH
jgi:hypothetical protein